MTIRSVIFLQYYYYSMNDIGGSGHVGACWPQVAYDIGNSEHVRSMLAKALTILIVLTVLIINKTKCNGHGLKI